MATKLQTLLNFIIVFFILLTALAVISPSQFDVFVDAIGKGMNLILVVVLIAVVAYLLRRTERI